MLENITLVTPTLDRAQLIIKNETQSNLTVASLLGGLWWDSLF